MIPQLAPAFARRPGPAGPTGPASERPRRASEVLAPARVGPFPRARAGPAAVDAPGVHEAAARRVRAAARRDLGRRGHPPGKLGHRGRRHGHARPSRAGLPHDGMVVTRRAPPPGPPRRGPVTAPGDGAPLDPELAGNTRLPSRRLPSPIRPAGAETQRAGHDPCSSPARRMASSILDGSVLSSCRVCGWATLPGSTLCVGAWTSASGAASTARSAISSTAPGRSTVPAAPRSTRPPASP